MVHAKNKINFCEHVTMFEIIPNALVLNFLRTLNQYYADPLV